MESQEIQKFESQGLSLVNQAKSLRIIDQETREDAAEFRANVNQKLKQIETYFKVSDPDTPGSGTKTKAYDTWKTICNQETALTKKLEEAKKIVDVEIGRDYQEQKRIREEAERKAQAEAAEQERKIRERLEIQAMKQMEKGNFEKAEETLQQAEQVFVPVISPEIEAQKTVRTDGATVSMIEDIEVEVVDLGLFLTEIVNRKYPEHLVEVKLNELKKFIKATRPEKVPGIKITNTARVSSRKA